MTPPSQDAALQVAAPPADLAAAGQALRLRPLREVVVGLTDSWILLAVLWASRFYTDSLRASVALFAATSFVLIVAPLFEQRRLSASALDDAGPLFRRVCLAYALTSTVTLLVAPEDARLVLGVAATTAPLLVAGRAASRYLERSLSSIEWKSRTLLVGGGDIARRLADTLRQHDEYGLEVIGAVDDNPKFERSELGAPLLGGLSDIPSLVRSHRVDVVIVAFSAGDQSNMIELIRTTMASGARVWVVPRFFELGFAGGGTDHIWGLPVVRLQPPARSRPQWLLKRMLDFVLAAIAVVVTAPAMGIIAIATLIDSGRPVLHRQRRVSLDGRSFNILKFRTMRPSDQAIEDMEWNASASRVTRVGGFLRSTGLDELPQMFNVLRGEMSLVGPRPERPHFVDLFRELYPRYDSRHRMPAGVTGWAQIHGLRGDTSIEERATFDNYYIENWSLSRDLKILIRTFPTLFGTEEAIPSKQGKEG